MMVQNYDVAPTLISDFMYFNNYRCLRKGYLVSLD